MKKTMTWLGVVLLGLRAVNAGAVVIVSDDFSSYTDGSSLAGSAWDPKYDSADVTQRNLLTGYNHQYAVLNGAANANYHAPSQTGFTVSNGQYAVVSADFRYVYAGGGDITSNFNKNAFGLLVSTTPNWETGTDNGFYIAQRGGAIGNLIPFSPWVEGWITHSTLGVNTANADTSTWFHVEWTIKDVAGSLVGQATLTDGASVNYTSTEVDLGITTGTELFAGFSTGWNDTGLNIETFGKLSEIHMDNFEVAMPDPPSGAAYPLTDPGNLSGWMPYEPMWDEFNGSALDPAKWEPLSWTGRKPVYHEYNNVSLSNGMAVLKTDWKSGPVGSVSESAYSISSGYFQSTWVRRYGYFEIRCRALDFPIMTTWWLTGGSSSYTREIDMLECPSGVAGYKNYYSCNFHIWKTPTPAGVDDNGGGSIPDPEHYWLPFNMVDGYHTYGFEWDKNTCKIYIDGQLYRTRATGSFKVGQRLMVGNEYNSWLNSVSEINTNLFKLPATYDVDYVRAWIKPPTDTRWFVDGVNGNDSNSGLSWGSAKKSIPAAVDEAYDGDSIWVAQGSYPEYLTFHGIHDLKVYGGFTPGDTLLSDRNPRAYPTIIQSPPDGYSPVNIKGTVGFRLDGFTIAGATASYEHGIDIEGACSNVVVANCRIVGHNPANGGGSGAYADGVAGQGLTQVRFENCEFSGNQSLGQYAGGAAFGARNGAVVEIVNSQILNNNTSGYGGFFTLQWGQLNTTVLITNSLIAANTNVANRGVIHHNYGTVVLANCTLMNNSSDGIESDKWGAPVTTVTDSLIMGNAGEGFWANHAGFSLQNNLFFNNPGGHVNYSGDKNTEAAINGLAQASGNRVADPASVLPVSTDSDGDLLPDWWELSNGMQVPDNNYASDDDNDGSVAGVEYIAGTDPQNAGSLLATHGVPDPAGFRISIDSKPGRIYAVEMSDDLSAGWSDLTNGIPGSGSMIDVIDQQGASNRFYRIRVGLQ